MLGLRKRILIGVILIFLVFYLFSSEEIELPIDCADLKLSNFSFSHPPVDNTILFLFDSKKSGDVPFETQVDENFHLIASHFIDSPYKNNNSSYYHALEELHGSLWTVDSTHAESLETEEPLYKNSSNKRAVVKPLQMDVVYTFVDLEKKDMEAIFEKHGLSKNFNRSFRANLFRDLGVLRYSFRSFYHYASSIRYNLTDLDTIRDYFDRTYSLDVDLSELSSDTRTFSTATGSKTFSVPLFRNVYLVVANRETVPRWLDCASFPNLHIVTHAEIFPPVAQESLPTLNSQSIESTLHRIPGISRYYLYFNDDMLLGRNLSVFDLFRPLSPARHLQRVLEKKPMHSYKKDDSVNAIREPFTRICNTSTYRFLTKKNTPEVQGEEHDTKRTLTSLFLESILHAEEWFNPLTFGADIPLSNNSQLPKSLMKCMKENPDYKGPWRTTPFMRRVYRKWYSEKLSVVSLEGMVPSYNYAHVPVLFDGSVVQRIMEDDKDGFPADVAEVRKSVLRTRSAFSIMHLYAGYTVAMRREVERYLWRRQTHVASEGAPQFPVGVDRPVVEYWCSLCGDTFSPRLQHPRLLGHLSYPLRAEPPLALTYLPGNEDMLSLMALYPGLISKEVTEWTVWEEERMRTLLLDVDHHDNQDHTYLFLMETTLTDFVLNLHTFEQRSNKRWLYVTINDDLLPGIIEDSNAQIASGIFNKLYHSAIGNLPPAPFET